MPCSRISIILRFSYPFVIGTNPLPRFYRLICLTLHLCSRNKFYKICTTARYLCTVTNCSVLFPKHVPVLLHIFRTLRTYKAKDVLFQYCVFKSLILADSRFAPDSTDISGNKFPSTTGEINSLQQQVNCTWYPI